MAAPVQTLPSPTFTPESFARILPAREPFTGEDPGAFDAFHAAMVETLAPVTPYQQVIAENLVAIEWELVLQRRMRDAGLRRVMRNAIGAAVVNSRRAQHQAGLEAAWQSHVAAGGTDDDWEEPVFDAEAALEAGAHLAARAVSRNPDKQAGAHQEIAELSIDPVDLMGEAYRSHERAATAHHPSIVELERRRREVKRDFDALRRARPVVTDIEIELDGNANRAVQ